MAIRVLLVDDQPLSRFGVKALLMSEPDIEIVGEAENGHAAIERAVALAPDLVLMDIFMPSGDGVEATRAIKQRCPKTQVLILTVHAEIDLFRQAAAAGAAGYVLKDISPANLANAIRAVHSGKTMINPSIARHLVNDFSSSGRTPAISAARRLHGLTQREIDVLLQVAEGLTDKEIALQLFLSEATVKGHLRSIYHKLKLRNRAQAAVFAIENNLTKTL
jgi:DNA-binding NarL/FixJ family response regulator